MEAIIHSKVIDLSKCVFVDECAYFRNVKALSAKTLPGFSADKILQLDLMGVLLQQIHNVLDCTCNKGIQNVFLVFTSCSCFNTLPCIRPKRYRDKKRHFLG